MASKKVQLSKDTKDSGKNVVTASSNSNSFVTSGTRISTGGVTHSKTKVATTLDGQSALAKSTHEKAHTVVTTASMGVKIDNILQSKKPQSVTDDDVAKNMLARSSRSISNTDSSSDSSSGSSLDISNMSISPKHSNSSMSSYTIEMSVMMIDATSVEEQLATMDQAIETQEDY